jgi:hypothetical protein
MSLIIQPFKNHKRSITSEVAEHELDMQSKQAVEDKRLYREYADDRLSYERAKTESLRKGIQNVMETLSEADRVKIVQNQKEKQKTYDHYLETLNKVARENPISLEEFTCISVFPNLPYKPSFTPLQSEKKGYIIYSPAKARYGDMDLLSVDFEKEYYS